jgi:hypothetical protein
MRPLLAMMTFDRTVKAEARFQKLVRLLYGRG